MLILIGRGLDLKEELELKGVVVGKFEVNFHCAVFKVWEKNHIQFPVTMA